MAPYRAREFADMHIPNNNDPYIPDGGHPLGIDVNARPLAAAIANHHNKVAHYPGGGRQLGVNANEAALGVVGARNDAADFLGGGRGGNANIGAFAGIPSKGNHAAYLPFSGETVNAASSNE